MKSASSDSLLDAWTVTLARGADGPAIYDTSGAVVRSFVEIEEEARGFECELIAEFADG